MTEFKSNLWAPWRMEYIDSLSEPDDGCFLCHYLKHPENDEANYVLWRSEKTLVLLNRFPYSNGHILIAPTMHVDSLEELPEDFLTELMTRARDVKRVLEKSVCAQGFNIGFNIGACAGAGLPEHVHCHVVPRWAGDVNYMAVLSDVKVMPQSLERSAENFKQAAAELGLPA